MFQKVQLAAMKNDKFYFVATVTQAHSPCPLSFSLPPFCEFRFPHSLYPYPALPLHWLHFTTAPLLFIKLITKAAAKHQARDAEGGRQLRRVAPRKQQPERKAAFHCNCNTFGTALALALAIALAPVCAACLCPSSFSASVCRLA